MKKTIAGSPLTAREVEVMDLIAEGLSNKRMAERLGLSGHTVKFHVVNALAKLAAPSRAGGAVKYAMTRTIGGCPRCVPKPAVPT